MTQLIKKVKNSKSHRAIRKQLLVKFRIHTTQRQKVHQFILPFVELYYLCQIMIDRISDLNRNWILKLSVYRIWFGFNFETKLSDWTWI